MSGWTDERVELLKKLWQDGLSASQIAKQIGGVSRNAVIGKLHRVGLSGRATPSKPQRTVFKAPRPAPAPRPAAAAKPERPVKPDRPMKLSGEAWSVGVIAAQPKPPTPIRHEEEGPGTATVLTLGVHMCRWPIGDPQDDGFTLCGRRKADGASYCVAHGQLAHRPRQAKHSAGELARSLRRYL